MKPGPLIIVSGPSGSGKSTLIRRVLAADPRLHLSVSATTRQRRKGEREGVDYHFWDEAHFREQLAAGAFLEHAQVHGSLYGTLRSEVEDWRARGFGVILDVDVQGAAQVRPLYSEHLSVFVAPPSMQVLEQRLRARKTEDEAALGRRLANARRELEHQKEYQEVVTNDDLEVAAARLRDLIDTYFKR
jgi:guanylate kinase